MLESSRVYIIIGIWGLCFLQERQLRLRSAQDIVTWRECVLFAGHGDPESR